VGAVALMMFWLKMLIKIHELQKSINYTPFAGYNFIANIPTVRFFTTDYQPGEEYIHYLSVASKWKWQEWL